MTSTAILRWSDGSAFEVGEFFESWDLWAWAAHHQRGRGAWFTIAAVVGCWMTCENLRCFHFFSGTVRGTDIFVRTPDEDDTVKDMILLITFDYTLLQMLTKFSTLNAWRSVSYCRILRGRLPGCFKPSPRTDATMAGRGQAVHHWTWLWRRYLLFFLSFWDVMFVSF